jgi:cytochrome P450
VYAIHHDPRLYTDPDTFNPDRFLTSQLDLSSNEVFTSGHSGFGFGRRICPARYLAGKTVFIAAIRMLWAFDFRPVIDDKGEAMPVHKFDCPWTVVK